MKLPPRWGEYWFHDWCWRFFDGWCKCMFDDGGGCIRLGWCLTRFRSSCRSHRWSRGESWGLRRSISGRWSGSWNLKIQMQQSLSISIFSAIYSKLQSNNTLWNVLQIPTIEQFRTINSFFTFCQSLPFNWVFPPPLFQLHGIKPLCRICHPIDA